MAIVVLTIRAFVLADGYLVRLETTALDMRVFEDRNKDDTADDVADS